MNRFYTFIAFILSLYSLHLNAQSAKDYLIKANEAYQNAEFDKALRFYGMCIASAGEQKEIMAEAYFHRGIISIHAEGNDLDASADFLQATILNPAFSDAYLMAGKMQVKFENTPRAMKLFNQALACEPNNSEAWFARAQILLKAHETIAAISDLNQAIQLNNSTFKYYIAS